MFSLVPLALPPASSTSPVFLPSAALTHRSPSSVFSFQVSHVHSQILTITEVTATHGTSGLFPWFCLVIVRFLFCQVFPWFRFSVFRLSRDFLLFLLNKSSFSFEIPASGSYLHHATPQPPPNVTVKASVNLWSIVRRQFSISKFLIQSLPSIRSLFQFCFCHKFDFYKLFHKFVNTHFVCFCCMSICSCT